MVVLFQPPVDYHQLSSRLEEKQETEIWGQDMWPDYPSLHRKEIMDGGTFLVRNSLWTRRMGLDDGMG